ncbi:peptidase S10, serine carboxypeptidase [Coccomyxa subellipsoidea C-169]|uniref:Carboxypeptidase n=1 Tax=Coccomyxa subellipsoidea (strain C-169) TaxID=574566 RepID=I0YYC3_COCSC|nr:peptidase S10, serine carboxypeptidase [Coccomyxa subellipsoidea C-169]EIE23392.1 peptidase S10, serine carboxypeptidase [Coccomyxa subellipsoidea C-169]|eukprot:XP_005647936.1 peptidase S10, serine carboxypeptidase [Coccomyxa subellipsoidea C-169]
MPCTCRYIIVNETAGRALFYAFAESYKNAKSKPLVLWLNGGPGCSSLASGFMSELGPFYPAANGKLEKNPYSWTQAANIIFLESPAFVGWSYSNTTTDATVGDKRTANDALNFLLGFFDRFPAYDGRPFWIAGESYGGHYVPNLALAVAEHNAGNDNSPIINFKGFLVGNAWTDAEEDNKGAVEFWHSHALISDTTRDGLMNKCNFSRIGPLQVEAVTKGSAKAESGFADGGINIYDIYADVCSPERASAEARQFAHVLGATRALTEGKYDPCIDGKVEEYFNRPDVQRAFHANASEHTLPWAWKGCSDYVDYSREDLLSSMLPVYRELLKHKLNILVYSGDVDAIVPVTGTRRWLARLGLPVVRSWRPWRSGTGQIGGYYERYSGLTFLTIREAGHMASAAALSISIFTPPVLHSVPWWKRQ